VTLFYPDDEIATLFQCFSYQLVSGYITGNFLVPILDISLWLLRPAFAAVPEASIGEYSNLKVREIEVWISKDFVFSTPAFDRMLLEKSNQCHFS